MPNPAISDVHVNVPLTNISIAYLQNQSFYVADKVFPLVPTAKQGNRYFVYDRGDFFRAVATVRAPGTESAGSGWKLDNTPSFFAHVYSVHKDVDDQTRSNADQPLDMDRDATLWVTQQLALKRELVWQSNYFTTGVWTGSSSGSDITPGTLWSAAGSTPVEDIRAQIFAIHKNTGYVPNTLVLGPQVFQILMDHPSVLDRIKYGGNNATPGMVNEAAIASILGLDQVLVARAVQNTGIEDSASATDTMAFIFGKNALLCYANPSPSLMQPSAGYIFSWTGYLGAGPAGNRIKTFRMEWIESDRIEGECAFDMKVVAPTLGAYFSGAVA